MLFQNIKDIFTVRNYGKRTNCSISTLFPAVVEVASLNVGIVPNRGRGLELETGTLHKVGIKNTEVIKINEQHFFKLIFLNIKNYFKCQKRGLDDYVQIGGSTGLDNSNLLLSDSVCGIDSKPGSY